MLGAVILASENLSVYICVVNSTSKVSYQKCLPCARSRLHRNQVLRPWCGCGSWQCLLELENLGSSGPGRVSTEPYHHYELGSDEASKWHTITSGLFVSATTVIPNSFCPTEQVRHCMKIRRNIRTKNMINGAATLALWKISRTPRSDSTTYLFSSCQTRENQSMRRVKAIHRTHLWAFTATIFTSLSHKLTPMPWDRREATQPPLKASGWLTLGHTSIWDPRYRAQGPFREDRWRMRSRFKEQCRIKRVTWSKVGLCVRAVAPKSGNIYLS